MIVSEKMAHAAWEMLAAYINPEDLTDAMRERGFKIVRTLAVGLDRDDVTDAYKIAVKATHPDRGGSVEAFAAVDRAKHVLLAWLDRAGASEAAVPAHGGGPCPKCHGDGYLRLRKSFRELRTMCPTCRGSGEADVEQEKESW